MRKLAVLLGLVVLFCSAGIADAHSRHHKAKAGNDPVLLGNTSILSSSDQNATGAAEAFTYTATTSGSATDAEVYVASGSKATKLFVGIYADASGKPGSLLATGSLSSPKSSAWNDVTVNSASINCGHELLDRGDGNRRLPELP